MGQRFELFRAVFRTIAKFTTLYFEQSSVHGLAYFVKVSLLWIEKCLWIMLVITAVTSTLLITLQSLIRYNTSATVVSLENDYYFWNTTLPSITICPMERLSRKLFDKHCNEKDIEPDMREEYWYFLESLANSTYFNFENINATETINKLNIDPQKYMELIFNLTEDLTVNSTANTGIRTVMGEDFIDTEQVLTEYGICYSANNFLADSISTEYLIAGKALKNDHTQQKDGTVYKVRFGNVFDGELSFSLIGFPSPVSIFIHSPYEVMQVDKGIGYSDLTLEIEATSIEIITEENFEKNTRVSQRHCRFNTESNLTHYKTYTKNVCLQECRLLTAYKICKCIPHFYPNNIQKPKRVCSYQQLMKCFPNQKDKFLSLNRGSAANCHCLQNCAESKVIVEHIRVMGRSVDLLGSVGGIVLVKTYPTVRYKRQLLFTFTEFLVSVGGAAGFFLGFSVLGAVEVLYYFTLRFFWYLRGYE